MDEKRKDKIQRLLALAKPLNIIENLVINSSQENEVVLDCFIGSGTTAVAAINTNRQFIGFEKEKEYFDIAIERIKKVSEENESNG
ncbi:TPA: site-specific DNA-methyltransferase [Enterococcus faecalis]